MEMDKFKNNMTIGVFGAAAGAIALAVVGFNFGGWVTSSTATEMTEAAIVKKMIPICVKQFNADANKAQRLAELKKTQSWMRADFVTKQGWATMPGEEEANRNVAEACAEKIAA